jgi:hypothetical protein
MFKSLTLFFVAPLTHQNPKLGILYLGGGGDILGWQMGLWSTELEVLGIMPKAAWY